MNVLADSSYWSVALTTLLIVSICVALHYEALVNCGRFISAVTERHRRRVLLTILVVLVTHVIEIWIFAIGYYVLVAQLGMGTLSGAPLEGIYDYAYYSAMVFTTVGFGDIIPTGPIRFMTGTEALTGLVMITWSASFTFLEMQRNWPH